MEKSKFLKLDWKDIGKAVVVFFTTTLLAGLYALSQSGELFNWEKLGPVLMTSLTATIAYLIKNLFTNSEDKILKPK